LVGDPVLLNYNMNWPIFIHVWWGNPFF
jgi:hypothetical protein